MDNITDFLYLIGSVFAPMIAIQIADYFVLKKKPFKNAVNVQNLVIWVIGFAAYRILMRVDTPVGNTLPGCERETADNEMITKRSDSKPFTLPGPLFCHSPESVKDQSRTMSSIVSSASSRIASISAS